MQFGQCVFFLLYLFTCFQRQFGRLALSVLHSSNTAFTHVLISQFIFDPKILSIHSAFQHAHVPNDVHSYAILSFREAHRCRYNRAYLRTRYFKRKLFLCHRYNHDGILCHQYNR